MSAENTMLSVASIIDVYWMPGILHMVSQLIIATLQYIFYRCGNPRLIEITYPRSHSSGFEFRMGF